MELLIALRARWNDSFISHIHMGKNPQKVFGKGKKKRKVMGQTFCPSHSNQTIFFHCHLVTTEGFLLVWGASHTTLLTYQSQEEVEECFLLLSFHKEMLSTSHKNCCPCFHCHYLHSCSSFLCMLQLNPNCSSCLFLLYLNSSGWRFSGWTCEN